MKPLIVGEAPSRLGDGRPFTGPSGKRLLKLLGIDEYSQLEEYFDLRNLCREGPFRLAIGRHRARAIMAESKSTLVQVGLKYRHYSTVNPQHSRHLILCGKNVQRAFRVNEALFTPVTKPGYRNIWLWTFPHPSSLNRFWNERDNVDQAQRFLRLLSRGCIPTEKLK